MPGQILACRCQVSSSSWSRAVVLWGRQYHQDVAFCTWPRQAPSKLLLWLPPFYLQALHLVREGMPGLSEGPGVMSLPSGASPFSKASAVAWGWKIPRSPEFELDYHLRSASPATLNFLSFNPCSFLLIILKTLLHWKFVPSLTSSIFVLSLRKILPKKISRFYFLWLKLWRYCFSNIPT